MLIEIPYWLIIFFIAVNILGITISARIKTYQCCDSKGNKKKRDILTLIPRIYLLMIYSSFWIFNFDAESRSIFVRYGVLSVLVVDTFIKFDEISDYWDGGSTWQKFAKTLKLKIKRMWENTYVHRKWSN